LPGFRPTGESPGEAVGIKVDYTTGLAAKARYAELMAEKSRDLFAEIVRNARGCLGFESRSCVASACAAIDWPWFPDHRVE
jgi:hypothetical protein